MIRSAAMVLLSGIFLMLMGCFQVKTVVTVRPDGSGTLEETFMFSKDLIRSISAMTADLGGDATPDFDAYDEAELRANAAQMGTDVAYVSSEAMQTETHTGYKALYSFANVTLVDLEQDPSENIGPPGAAPDASAEKPAQDEGIKIAFESGKHAKLTLTSAPDDAPPPESVAPTGPLDPQEVAMLSAFEGMRIELILVVEGDITSTNATHRDGNTIVLADIDFAQLLADPARLSAFASAKPSTMAEARALLAETPGVKFDLNESLEVVFKKAK